MPERKSILPVASLTLSGLVLAAAVCCAAAIVMFGTRIPYDSAAAPLGMLGLLGFSLLNVIVAGVALAMHYDWHTVAALLAAIVGVVVSALDFLLLLAVMMANHPV